MAWKDEEDRENERTCVTINAETIMLRHLQEAVFLGHLVDDIIFNYLDAPVIISIKHKPKL